MHKKVNKSAQENGDFAEQKRKGRSFCPLLPYHFLLFLSLTSYAVFFCLDKV